jgi:hypothetical protein
MKGIPVIKVKMTYLSEEETSRRLTPCIGQMPHLVVQDTAIRKPVNKNRTILDEFLGVYIKSVPPDIRPDTEGEYELALFFYPNVNYDKLKSGATFTVRAGGAVIGYGEVIEKKD